MNLFIDQVVKFEHVHVAHGNRMVEIFPGAAVSELHLAVGRVAGFFQGVENILLVGAVEDGCGHVPTQFLAARPKCTSNTWPKFIREGTPKGFNTI